ncbi:MAG: glycosyltransferase family 2 protein [Dermatophilaceae bacterium]
MKTLVSVAMPALNEERSIEAAVGSVLQQADVQVEVLVVDGRSDDATREVVEAMAARDPRVRLLDNPRVSIPAALNVALAHASGRYLARVDCHATVSADYLARGVHHLKADEQLAGVGGLRRGVAHTPSGRAVALALSSPFGVGNSINHYADRFQPTDHASFGVYRVDVARAVGGWDEDLVVNEDVDFDHRILQTGHTLAFDPEMLIDWHVQESPTLLFRQYRRYGRGKAGMVRKNGVDAVRPRHLAAPAAVSAGALVAAAALRRPAALLALTPYAAGVTMASAHVLRNRGADSGVSRKALPLAFMAMHGGWGLGFLEGVLFGRPPRLASGSVAARGHRRPVRAA